MLGKKEHQSAIHLSRNPFGMVPAIEHGKLIFFVHRSLSEQ
jgi:glutathione S-transferase